MIDNHKFEKISLAKYLEILNSSLNGLSTQEAINRQQKFGPNAIEPKKIENLDILIKQFKNPFNYLLIAAAAISLYFKELIDVILITAFVFLAIFIGFYYEHRSNEALRLLKKYLHKEVKVKRDGVICVVDSNKLVPGDIILIEPGDIIPADLKVVKSNDLYIDESSLTGETEAVLKNKEDLCLSGTNVIKGEGECLVVATGGNTYFGKIGKLIEETSESSFSKQIGSLTTFLVRFVVIIGVLAFFINIILKGPQELNISDFLIFIIAMIVAVVPEALPLVVNATLAKGALRLAQKKVVVKRLSSIEDLGNIEVLCTDKTGTLTENKLNVKHLKGSKLLLLKMAALASPSLTDQTFSKLRANYLKVHSFDEAIINQFEQKHTLPRSYSFQHYMPFDPIKRYDLSIIKLNGKYYGIIRGAPEKIFKLSSIGSSLKEEYKKFVASEGQKGRRALAVAYKKLGSNQFSVQKDLVNFNFLGCISFEDPIKPDAQEAIKLAQKLGIQVKILTGDSEAVSFYVAKQLGLVKNESEFITGYKFSQLSVSEKYKAIENYKVFSRVDPFQKYEIIKMLKRKYIVGFLGEGINDSAGLKMASVGIAVKGAADISEETSDIIVLKKSLSVIIEGINEGRQIFTNTIKYLKVTLSSNLGNFFALTAISLLLKFPPMRGAQILMVNFLTDLPLALIGFDKVDPEETKKPKNYDLHELGLFFIVFGILSSMFDFIFFAIFKNSSREILQTLWFVFSTLTEIVIIFSLRTKKFFINSTPPPKLILLTVASVISITLLAPLINISRNIFDFASPTIIQLSIIGVLTIIYFFANELLKFFYYARR